MASQTPRTRKISCIGFDWRAEVSLRETLTLLKGKTRDAWQYSDELTADVVVYDTQNLLAQAMVRRCAAEGSPRVFFPSSSSDESVLTLRYPFGASRLVSCLNHASAQLSGAAVSLSGEESSLCQRFDDALHASQAAAVLIRAGTQFGWIKLPERRLLWSQPLGIEEVAQLLTGEVHVQAVAVADAALLQRLEAGARCPAAMEPLLWAIGITRSRGTLLQRIDPGRNYRLRRWPDFGAIGRRSLDLRCTSLLMQRELTPLQLAMVAGIPLSAIGAFLNACALVGVLEAGELQSTAAHLPTMQPPAAVAESAIGNVLRRIRLAFSIATAE